MNICFFKDIFKVSETGVMSSGGGVNLRGAYRHLLSRGIEEGQMGAEVGLRCGPKRKQVEPANVGHCRGVIVNAFSDLFPKLHCDGNRIPRYLNSVTNCAKVKQRHILPHFPMCPPRENSTEITSL